MFKNVCLVRGLKDAVSKVETYLNCNLSHCRSASFSGKAEVLSEVMRSIRVLRKLSFPGFLGNLYPYNMLPNYPLEILNL